MRRLLELIRHVRAGARRRRLEDELRDEIDQPVSNLRTQREQNNLSIQSERLFARLAMLLGAMTLLLASIGLYGLMSYSVTRRVPEHRASRRPDDRFESRVTFIPLWG